MKLRPTDPVIDIEIKHAHIFCGLGGGAKGFNRGQARVGNLRAKFRCLGGIDHDAAALRDFAKLAGVPGALLDLFSREQYCAFHGEEPPAGWRPAMPDDIRAAFGYEVPDIGFLSAPCKGFSGLLAETQSKTAKYQALNGLTLRGIWLFLEAYKDSPVKLIVFENVPRIATRGRHLLDQIVALLRAYGYMTAETTHDCGELGNLAQSRKRFLLVARHQEQVPAFLYQPEKHRLRGVGEVLDKLPMPGLGLGGPMHRMPSLQWRTWVRLAFVEAGSDWRSLNKLKVSDGMLKDYGIMPEVPLFNSAFNVKRWTETAGTVTSKNQPSSGATAVADPRVAGDRLRGRLGVADWEQPSKTVGGEAWPTNGTYSVADPRVEAHPTYDSTQLGVKPWTEPFGTVTSQTKAGGGPNSVADPRISGRTPFNNVFRIVEWDKASPPITSARGCMAAVADPRPPARDDYKATKYRVTAFGEAAGTVISASTTGNGAFAVADPRPACLNKEGREGYSTQGHYGVLPWDQHSGAVPGFAKNNNGSWSVADPRELPAITENLVAIIRALDGTWHRPLTTLELAALQSLIDPEEFIELDGLSDSGWRERIGNAVPPDSAEAIASVMGKAILMSLTGETFILSREPIWVQPIALALAVNQPGQTA